MNSPVYITPHVYVPPVIYIQIGSGDLTPIQIILVLISPFILLWLFIELICWIGRIGDRRKIKKGIPVFASDLNISPTVILWNKICRNVHS